MSERFVYIVLYNYSERDYSMLNVYSTLEQAFQYVKCQEIDIHKFKLIELNKYDVLPSTIDYDDCDRLLVAYSTHEDYYNYNLCDYDFISNYIIVKKPIL